MTLLIRWDASDTTYLSGGPGERYVHFPLEIASTVPTEASVDVRALAADGAIIAQQTFAGIPLTPAYVKFSPAILIPDAADPKTLKALIFTTTIPITQPRSVVKTLGGFGGDSMKYILGGALLFVALKMFKRRRK